MSENEQNEENRETVADVIATVREVVRSCEKIAEMSKEQLKEAFVLMAKNYRQIADSIEAAWERESKAIATEHAVLPDVCIAKHALSTPPRNCDVGTLTEQQQRFHDFCEKMQHTNKACCGGCPKVHLWMRGVISNSCELACSQMPYEEEEGDAHGND